MRSCPSRSLRSWSVTFIEQSCCSLSDLNLVVLLILGDILTGDNNGQGMNGIVKGRLYRQIMYSTRGRNVLPKGFIVKCVNLHNFKRFVKVTKIEREAVQKWIFYCLIYER